MQRRHWNTSDWDVSKKKELELKMLKTRERFF